MTDPSEKETKYWLESPRNVKKLAFFGIIVLLVLVLLDKMRHGHAEIPFESSFGFYSLYGLISCIGLILIAKFLGIFLKRRENYYDE